MRVRWPEPMAVSGEDDERQRQLITGRGGRGLPSETRVAKGGGQRGGLRAENEAPEATHLPGAICW